jgi:hypothetical protein
MSFKNKAKIAARKTLEAIDKPLKWAQENPVAVERIGLVLITAFMARSAYKKFAPQNVVRLSVPALKPTVNHLIDNIPVHVDIQTVRPLSPYPLDYSGIDCVRNLEVSNVDIKDMNDGNLLGLVFNLKGFDGVENTPLAVMPYTKFMTYAKAGFPIHESAEKLLAEN